MVNNNNNYEAKDRSRFLEIMAEIEKETAEKSVLSHIWEGLASLFNFKFISALGSFKWAQERLMKTGDYDRKIGSFYRKGYIKD